MTILLYCLDCYFVSTSPNAFVTASWNIWLGTRATQCVQISPCPGHGPSLGLNCIPRQPFKVSRIQWHLDSVTLCLPLLLYIFPMLCDQIYLRSIADHLPFQQYFEMRSRTIQKLRETQSPNPYPHKFDVSVSITSYIDKYGVEGKIKPGTRLEGVTECLAGRIHNIRMSSQKLRFYDLHGEGKKVQIMANLR